MSGTATSAQPMGGLAASNGASAFAYDKHEQAANNTSSSKTTNYSNAATASARDIAHNWEAVNGSSMWNDVQEDAEGNIVTDYSQLSLASQIRQRRYRLATTDLARSSKRLVRHMLRNTFLVLDCSRWSREKDPALPPARMRLETILSLASQFVTEYYDQNPLGHLGVVICRDGEAEMLTSLGGSPKKHKLAIDAAIVTEMGRKGGPDIGGEFSLQNGIEVAGRSLGYAPRYGSREIIVIMSALATCDPGDILGETLPRLLHAGIRLSTISLQSEVHICKKLADVTGGVAGVCMNMGHLRDLFMSHAIPPPVINNSSSSEHVNGNSSIAWCEFVEMGFPSRESGDVPMLVHNSGGASTTKDSGVGFAINLATADDRRTNRLITFARTGYVCPRCQSRCSDLPSDCAVCGLRLILAPHLARTFHHLFPVRPFEELDEAETIQNTDHKHQNGDGPKDSDDTTINGKKGWDLLPTTSSSAFTPIMSISSSTEFTFMVSSSTPQAMDLLLGQKPKLTSSLTTINIGPSIMANSADCDRCCFGCLKIIGCKSINDTTNGLSYGSKDVTGNKEAILRFQCPDCHNVFCPDCDAFLHETLHNCPGCLCDN